MAAGVRPRSLVTLIAILAATAALSSDTHSEPRPLLLSPADTSLDLTIALSATTVALGGTVTATIANGPGTTGDWVGLFAEGAGDGTYLDWKYLNGTQTRPGSGAILAVLPFTMPRVPGTYNLRFFLNDSTTKLATSATITVAGAPPSIALSTTTVAAGGTVTATIANGPGTRGDWVGLFAGGAGDGTYLDWKYLSGTQTRPAVGATGAAVAFTMPSVPGTYNVRLFLNDSITKLATSAAMTVTGAPPTIALSTTTVVAGGTVTATIANGPGTTGDWAGLFAAGAGDGTYLDWKYLNGAQTRPAVGATGAAVGFTMPAVPGTYNVRLFLNDSTAKLTTSATITVTAAAPPSIALSATTVAAGATVIATIANGPGARGDWVGLFASSAPNSTNLSWKYLNGTQTRPASGVTGAAVALTMPTTPGTYNVRLFLDDSSTLLATSLTITVSNASTGAGIAARYPGDIGIENDPNVIFVERFDETSLTALFGRWTDILGGAGMSFSADVPSLSPLTRSLNIPWVGGGVSSGGHLYKVISPGIDDTLYLRYYIKYPTTGQYVHHGIWTGGYNPPLNYPFPRAGLKPAGNDLFSAAAEQDDLTLRMDHYDYWMNMHLSNDGNYWGNLLLDDPNVLGKSGQWMCVEQMVKLNTPVTASNGEHAIWVDGAKVTHVGPGFPNGSWSGGIFTQNPSGAPFGGLRWRSDANLNINYIWLQTYAPNDAAGFSANMKFAHVVAAKSYVGCLAPSVPDTTLPSASLATPASGATVSGVTTVSADASDNVGVVGVQFKLDGANLGAEDLAPPYAITWDTAAAPSGTHALSAVARDAAGNSKTAASVSVTVSHPTGSAWPNEPSGFVAITNQPWNALTGSGWNRRGGGTDQIVSDSTAPLSPSSIMEYIYPVGFVDGTAPATQYYPVSGKEIFVGMWWKPSSPWQGNASFVNKLQFFQVQNSSVYMTMYGPNGGPYELRTNAQWPEMASQWLSPNVNSGIVTLGQWHRVEWYMKYESSYGARDGIVRWWLDGVLVGDYTNVRFPNDAGFVEYQISPTWGGNTGQAKTERDFFRFDHSYLSKR